MERHASKKKKKKVGDIFCQPRGAAGKSQIPVALQATILFSYYTQAVGLSCCSSSLSRLGYEVLKSK